MSELGTRGLSRGFGGFGTVIPKHAMTQPLSSGFFPNYIFIGEMTISIIATHFCVVLFVLQELGRKAGYNIVFLAF